MPRSWQEIYAEIVRLPASARLRLVARLLADLAAEAEASASPSSPPAAEPSGRSPSPPAGKQPAVGATHASPRPPPPVSERLPPPAPSSSAGSAAPPVQPPAPRLAREADTARTVAGPRPRIVVDGSNFLGTVPGFDLASAASREKLILRLQGYAHAHPGTRVTVYFDGRKSSAAVRGGVEVRFSPDTRPADHYIVEYLRGVPVADRGACVLVTGDVELSTSARALGVAVEAPRRFQRRIADPPSPPADRGLSAREVAEWEEYFRRPKPEKP
jgi:predicted RNA-binding protein with PIN domain